MPKTVVKEIQSKVSSYAAIFGGLQESIRLELINNNQNLTNYLKQDGKATPSGRVDGLAENLKNISEILNGSFEHYEISYTDPKSQKTYLANVPYPFTKDSFTSGLKRCHEAKYNEEHKGQTILLHNEIRKLYGPEEECLKEPLFKNALSKIGSIKGLKIGDKPLVFDGFEIKRCSPKEFTKETLNDLYKQYVEASSASEALANSFKEIDELLKDETSSQELINQKKKDKEQIPFIDYFIHTVDPIIKQNLNSFNAVKQDDCKSIEEAFMFADLEHFSMDNVKVEKFGGAQSLRTKMTYSFAEPGKDVPEKFSKVHEGFFTERSQFDYVKLYEDHKKRLEGRFKQQYDNFFSHIFKQYDDYDIKHVANWVNDHPLDKNKKYSNAEKAKYESDLLFEKLSHFGGDQANLFLERLTKGLYFSSGKYHYSGLVENKGANDKKSIFTQIASEKNREALYDYFQKNRENPEFIAALAEFKHSFDSLKVIQGISARDLGFEKGSEVSYKNCAMTAVAKALNMDVIADSYKMNIVDNGKTIEGVFMEKANGVSLFNMKDSVKREKIRQNGFNDPRFLKSISDLEVLDYICGNVDRHSGNLCYKLDENGEKVIGVVGFDNDSSFGFVKKDKDKNQHLLMPVNEIKVIDEKTADTVMKMSEESLRGILAPFGLKESEISASLARLKQVKSAININAKDKSHIQNENKISVLNEAGWNSVQLHELISMARNTYTEVSGPIRHFSNQKFYSYYEKEDLQKKAFTMSTSLNTLNDDLAKYEKDLIGAKSKWNNSGEYKRLINMISSLKDKNNKIDSFDFTENLNSLNATKDQMSDYMRTINKIKDSANTYLEHKQKDIEQNKLDPTSKKKVEIVNNLLNILNQKETIINVDFDKYQRECKENIEIKALEESQKNHRFQLDLSGVFGNQNNQNNIAGGAEEQINKENIKDGNIMGQ